MKKTATSNRAKSEKDKGAKSKAPAKAAAPAKGGKAEASSKAGKASKPAKTEAKSEKVEAKADAKAKGKGRAEAKVDAKPAAKADAKSGGKGNEQGKRGGKGKGKAAEVAESAAVLAEESAAAREAEVDTQVTQRLETLPTDDDEDDADGGDKAAPAELSEEERQLSSLYQADLAAPALAHGEFKDQKTADEDRPMLPEINARDERRRSWEDRRERRRQEREQRRLARRDRNGGHRGGQQERAGGSPPPHAARPEREHRNDRPGGGDRPNDRGGDRPQDRPYDRGDRGGSPDRFSQDRGAPPAPSSPPVAAAAAAAPASGAVVELCLGTPMAAATANLYAQLRNGQPLPVKQLAAMLRKRGLIEGEPDLIWPQLRAELLADERAYRSLGLRPRVVHRGRDLFAPGPAASEAEVQLVSNVAAIQAATTKSIAAWMAAASPAAFERLIHSYLVAVGYRDINWVKRVDGIAYAQATAPGIERSVLISARSGSAPIDRRGIGELRVGVEAKGLPFGYLFSAASLSADAERELERAGRSIAVICGDALANTLVALGIGVASTAVTVRFVDEQFLEDLSVG